VGLDLVNPNIIVVLETALAAEIAAADLYTRLAQLASSETTKKLLSSLTADEKRHRQLLEKQYESDAGKSYAAGPVRQLRLPSGARDLLWPAALTLAINGEMDAHDTYSKCAAQVTDPRAKALYKQLADDEAGHRKLLEAEYAARQGHPFADTELETWVRE
jgi:rubrerythrin